MPNSLVNELVKGDFFLACRAARLTSWAAAFAKGRTALFHVRFCWRGPCLSKAENIKQLQRWCHHFIVSCQAEVSNGFSRNASAFGDCFIRALQGTQSYPSLGGSLATLDPMNPFGPNPLSGPFRWTVSAVLLSSPRCNRSFCY